MKTGKIALAFLLVMAAAAPAAAGFNSIASTIERTQHVRPKWIPFMGLGRIVVHLMKPNGVHDFKIAIYDGGRISPDVDLTSIVRDKIGSGWQQMIRSRSLKDHENATIWAKPDGDTVRMMILSQESDETVLVEVAVDPEIFADSIREPGSMKNVGDRD